MRRLRALWIALLIALVAGVGVLAFRSESGGAVLRDGDTRRDIEATAGVTLQASDVSSLALVVTKSRYRLDVLEDGKRIKTYPVVFGDTPAGPKRVQGDERTPEGVYVLIPHHPSPSWGSCFYVCYPNEQDADQGLTDGTISPQQRDRLVESLRERRIPPFGTALGGQILLHGTREGYRCQTCQNWTDGCIAMENDDLHELLEIFEPSDRPILRILP